MHWRVSQYQISQHTTSMEIQHAVCIQARRKLALTPVTLLLLMACCLHMSAVTDSAPPHPLRAVGVPIFGQGSPTFLWYFAAPLQESQEVFTDDHQEDLSQRTATVEETPPCDPPLDDSSVYSVEAPQQANVPPGIILPLLYPGQPPLQRGILDTIQGYFSQAASYIPRPGFFSQSSASQGGFQGFINQASNQIQGVFPGFFNQVSSQTQGGVPGFFNQAVSQVQGAFPGFFNQVSASQSQEGIPGFLYQAASTAQGGVSGLYNQASNQIQGVFPLQINVPDTVNGVAGAVGNGFNYVQQTWQNRPLFRPTAAPVVADSTVADPVESESTSR